MIQLFATGGTIDSHSRQLDGTYTFTTTHIHQMLAQSQNLLQVDIKTIFLKDSAYFTDTDRQTILDHCQTCPHSQIIILHGTDTLAHTARFIQAAHLDKTIILIGSIIPYNQPNSATLFNLGAALTAVQLLPHGVHVTMNGIIFPADNVQKNIEKEIFESIT